MYHLSDDGVDPRGWAHHIAEMLLEKQSKMVCPVPTGALVRINDDQLELWLRRQILVGQF